MYTLRKINQQIGLIRKYWFQQLQTSYQIEIVADTGQTHTTLLENTDWQAFEINDTFAGRDCYYWVRFTVPVMPLAEKEQYIINIDILRNNDNGQSIPEGLVFANGTPIQAVDGNHRDIMLDQHYSGQQVEIAICFWTGLDGSHLYPEPTYTYRGIRGGRFDRTGYECFRYLDVMAQTVAEFSDEEPLKYAYLKFLTQSVNQFNWGQMTPESFAETTKAVMTLVKAFIAEHEGQNKQFTISAIGHTHIDVAWLWRLRHTREKTARSFATELSLLKDYPDYVFMHSTPQVYEYIKEDHPALFEQIEKRIQEGRWEADGAAWVEPDMNIPSGESLTRQFLYGKAFFGEQFDATQTVLWLPDVFGYSAALPQIMQNFGIQDFMTTKISWNETNHMPHDTFTWQGIDGSEVLTYFITTVDQDYDYHSDERFGATYNGMLTPHTILGSYYMYQDKALNDDLLLCFGYGDGGGGPTREMVENIDIMNQLPGLPTVQPTRVDEYFKTLHQTIAETGEQLPKWVGELYLEYHRGTYTSQARVKKQNRELEFAMRALEMRYTKAYVSESVPYPMAEIRKIWEIIMRNQFHDILPGSSIREVYEDNQAEYQEAFERIRRLNAALDAREIKPLADTVTLRNDLAWQVSQFVNLPETTMGYYETEDGQRLRSVATTDGQLVEVSQVPALGSCSLRFVPADGEEMVELADTVQKVETDQYAITWNQAGQLTSIFDKTHQREVLKAGGGNRLTVYEDRPLDWDAWNIDEDYQEKAVDLVAESIQLTEDSPLRKVVTFTYRFQKSIIHQQMILNQGSPRIDFETSVDWQEHQQLLRTAFEVDILADFATYDIQYGNVRRPTHRNTSWDVARFESVGHKWADLSQGDYGVALLNDSKYGYDVQGQTLSLSLIKSGVSPDPTADQGKHCFTYSLLPHAGDYTDGKVEKVAMELNVPLVVTPGMAQTTPALFTFTESAEPVAIDAIKLSEAEDAVVLRFHDYSGQAGTLKVQPNFPCQEIYQTNLAETASQPLAHQEQQVQVSYRPYEIVTLAFKLHE